MSRNNLKQIKNFRIDELCFILNAFLNNNSIIHDLNQIDLIKKDLLLLEAYTGIPSHIKDFDIEIRQAINLFSSFQFQNLDISEDTREIKFFKQFYKNHDDLRQFIKTVKSFLNLNICSSSLENFEASEGKGSIFKHFARERDWKIIKAKKLRFLIENG